MLIIVVVMVLWMKSKLRACVIIFLRFLPSYKSRAENTGRSVSDENRIAIRLPCTPSPAYKQIPINNKLNYKLIVSINIEMRNLEMFTYL